MAVPHAEPGQIIDLMPQMPADSLTKTLIKSDNIEVIRLMLPAGKAIAEHKGLDQVCRRPGEVTLHFRSRNPLCR